MQSEWISFSNPPGVIWSHAIAEQSAVGHEMSKTHTQYIPRVSFGLPLVVICLGWHKKQWVATRLDKKPTHTFIIPSLKYQKTQDIFFNLNWARLIILLCFYYGFYQKSVGGLNMWTRKIPYQIIRSWMEADDTLRWPILMKKSSCGSFCLWLT